MSIDRAAVTVASTTADPVTRLVASTGVLLELTKFRLSGLVVLTTLVGLVAAPGEVGLSTLIITLAGTALAAGGAATLNQVWEVERDARMPRTRNRPLPSGRISRTAAFLWGLAFAAAGPLLLALGVNLLTGLLGLGVILLYVLVYTPLKVRTPLNTLVGAVCGAIPPVMGWTAATGSVAAGGLVLGGILFLWQIPHFLALAWLYRDDYHRGGFRMLPSVDSEGALTARVVLTYCAALLPLGAAATFGGLTGHLFLAGSLLLGGAFFAAGWSLHRERTDYRARRVFLASLLYLPLLLGLLVADLRPAPRAGSAPVLEQVKDATALPANRPGRDL